MFARIRKSMDENDEGFTLIELLVVIIIIGILAAIAIPVFLNQRKKGYEASEKTDLHTVATELETYYTDNQTYLGGSSSLTQGMSLTGNTALGTDSVSLSPGNTVALTTLTSSGYCLTATSTKGGATFYYNSATGGLTSTAC